MNDKIEKLRTLLKNKLHEYLEKNGKNGEPDIISFTNEKLWEKDSRRRIYFEYRDVRISGETTKEKTIKKVTFGYLDLASGNYQVSDKDVNLLKL